MVFLAPTSEEPYISESVWVSLYLWQNSSIFTVELCIMVWYIFLFSYCQTQTQLSLTKLGLVGCNIAWKMKKWKMKWKKRCQLRSRLIYTNSLHICSAKFNSDFLQLWLTTTVVLILPQILHNHCPAQTSAQVSSKTKSIITFEWIDLSKKFKRLNWLELNFPLNCSYFS